MNIFRIFFVSTVLIPILVVVVTSDESGIRLRKPRSIVISEDGTRTERRHNPVNITDKTCPSLGCTGNLTTNEYNGKGSLATSTLLPKLGGTDTSTERRFNYSLPHSEFHHDKPLKLEIKTIKNSTRTDIFNSNDYIAADDVIDLGTARGFITYSIAVSYSLFFTWRFIVVFILYYTIRNVRRYMKTTYGIGDNYIEYYVKLGKDVKHPFHNYGGGKWNPTLGINLKSKIEELGKKGWTKSRPYPGWKGWPGEGSNGWSRWDGHQHASCYPQQQEGPEFITGWPSAYYSGWPEPELGWPARPPPKKAKKANKGWDSEEQLSLEEEGSLRHKFDRTKGLKIAKKYAKKYGKKAHRYGLRPSNLHDDFSGLKVLKGETQDLKKAHKFGVRPSKYFDKTGNINVGTLATYGGVDETCKIKWKQPLFEALAAFECKRKLQQTETYSYN